LFSRLLLIIYFIEAGLLLLVVPWSDFWERNAFIQVWTLGSQLAQSGFVRGAVSGVGVLLLCAGLIELTTLIAGRRQA
jgi:hypothetical protein